MAKILYTSDIHGNKIQYQKLVDYALKIKPDFVIIGGDLAPKDFSRDAFINGQRNFFENDLPKLLLPLKIGLPNLKLFLMMGNDDCSVNMNTLNKHDRSLYYIAHNKRIKLINNFDIVGYSYVPITPFGIKDWEKYDFSDVPLDLKAEYLKRKRQNYRLAAKKSAANGWEEFTFTPEIEKNDSIQKDLAKEIFLKNLKKTIFVMHCPPNNTALDILSTGAHIGSLAIKLFIDKYQPYLTLHGHIHETVEMSGEFKHKIGDTLCLTSGNHNLGEDLAVLVFEIGKEKEIQRIII
ncbi:MAG: metallophosphoesterase [bacterium]|nr:metallophosphoesterase [bacterium]